MREETMAVTAYQRDAGRRTRALFDSDSDLDAPITDEINIRYTPGYYTNSNRRRQHLQLPFMYGWTAMEGYRELSYFDAHPAAPAASRTTTVGTRSIRSSPLQDYHDVQLEIYSPPPPSPAFIHQPATPSMIVDSSDEDIRRRPVQVQTQETEIDQGPGKGKGKGIEVAGEAASHREEDPTEPKEVKELPDQEEDLHDIWWDAKLQQQRESEDGDEEEEMELLMRYAPPPILLQVPSTHRAAPSSRASSSSRANQNGHRENDSERHEIIQQIVQSSVDNVIDQARAEKARLEQLRQLQLQLEAEAAAAQQDKGKGRADNSDGDASTPGNSDSVPVIRVSSEEEAPPSTTPTIKESGSSRRSRFGIRRMLGHIADKSPDSPSDKIPSPGGSEASKSLETLPMSVEPSPTSAAKGPGAALDVQKKFHHSSPLQRFIKKHCRAASEGGESSTDPPETMECVACLSDFPPKSLIRTTCHPYCLECFTSLITTAIETEAQWPPKCCLNPIPSRTITKTLTKHNSTSLLRLYKLKSAEYAIPAADRIYCPHPGCSLWIQSYNKVSKTARCSKNHTFCVLCRQSPPHRNDEPCPQDKDLQLLTEIAEESGWKRCFKCSMLVEHREACAHMTCRCGAQFCYICGKKWRTCSCNHSELGRIKERAERKRLERLRREAGSEAGSSRDAERLMGAGRERESIADAAWLENALRLIEDYERRERVRLEEQRREEARRREERRRREAEERLRREEERITELEERYGKLRWDLLGVRNWQRAELLRAQTRETDECRENAIRERDEVVGDLERERSQLRAEAKAKIEERETKWKKEYTARVAWEKQLEEGYAQKLAEFWEGRVSGREQAEMALHAYMIKNDARRDAWRKTRDSELEMFRYTVEEDLGIAEEFMDTLIARAGKIAEEKQRELKEKHKAEFRWLELTVAERSRLVAEMEAVERGNGGEMSDAGSVSLTDDDFSRSGDDELGASFLDV